MKNISVKLPLLLAALAAAGAGAQELAGISPEKQRLLDLGYSHASAWELYQTFQEEAGGGQQPPPIEQLPDWSGLWTHSSEVAGLFGADGGASPAFTAEARRMLDEGAAQAAQGILYDENISLCGPPGFPRWLVIPFLREFIVRPEQTWLSSETVNNVRRIYTDGRGHPPPAERYPLYYGDSIGFWDDQRLVIHTNQLMARYMGRNNLRQGPDIETVEIWEQVGDDTIEVDVWIYDPTLVEQPWHSKRRYVRQPNPDYSLRMRYWYCGENPNNDVFETEEGSTQYRDFTFQGN